MCMMIYIGAQQPLTLRPWAETAPGFHVAELSLAIDEVRTRLETSHLYYAGSYEGCGCGFQCGEYSEDASSPEELAKCRQSLSDFADYLDSELGRVGRIMLFACWAGDEAEGVVHRRQLQPSTLRIAGFHFLQHEASEFVPDPIQMG